MTTGKGNLGCLGSGDGMPDIGMESSVAPDYVKEPADARRAEAN